MTDRGQNFATQIWKTSGSRFNAHARLQRQHHASVLTSALLSVYVVFVQVFGYELSSSGDPDRMALVGWGTAFLAMAILVVTLVESSQAYQLRADRLHRCGMDLKALHDELCNQLSRRKGNGELSADTMDDVTRRYHEIIRRYSENHDRGDFELFMTQHRADFDIGWWYALWVRFRESIRPAGFYYLVIAGIPILMFIVL